MDLKKLGPQLGANLKQLRKDLGFSIKEVSYQLDQKSLNALSSFENGTRIPNLAMLYKLSEIYNTEIANLLPETSSFLRKKEIIRKEYSSLARKALELASKEG